MRYTDPTGHRVEEGVYATGKGCDQKLKKSKSKPCKDKRDLTDWMPSAANYTAQDSEIQKIRALNASSSANQKIAGAIRFYNLVRDGARFDVKDKILLRIGPTVKISGGWYEYSTTGNILYGFYGREAGYDAETLKRGAGYAQVMDVMRWAFAADETQDFPGLGGPVRYFDANDDSHAVDMGVWMYEQYYQEDKELTADEFSDAMAKFEDGWGLAHEADPGDCIPNTTGPYAADTFNQ